MTLRTIGLIGGMSWRSTLEYYRIMNMEVERRLGGEHSARLVISSLDLARVSVAEHAGDWDRVGQLVLGAALELERAGAELLLICANTPHRVANTVTDGCSVPLLHIADATGAAVVDAGIGTVGLLGTRFTMEDDGVISGRLESRYGLRVIVPGVQDRGKVHDILFGELVRGIFTPGSSKELAAVAERLRAEGAEGIVLGCTELPLALEQEDVAIPLFDTLRAHALAAVDHALE